MVSYKPAKFFALVLSVLAITGCEIINPEEPIPAYIYLHEAFLETDYTNQGTDNHKIYDCWITYENQLVGVFTLPALVPVVPGESKTLTIQAGIKENGLSTTRLRYPHFDAIEIESELVPTKVDSFFGEDLTFKYRDNARFLWLEDFEGSSVSIEKLNNNFNNFKITRDRNEVFEGKASLKITMDEVDSGFAIQSFKEFEFGDFNFGSPTFLELNYKCSSPIVVGYIIITPNGSSFISEGNVHMVINESTEWKKMYINLTEQIALITEEQKARIYFQSFLVADSNGNFAPSEVYIDNIKLVTFE